MLFSIFSTWSIQIIISGRESQVLSLRDHGVGIQKRGRKDGREGGRGEGERKCF